jgi:hypothetical protein
LNRKPKILILYKCLGYPLRTTIEEHLYAFRRYANATCYYQMLDIGKDTYNSAEPIPGYLLKIDFDIIIFHYGLMSSSWGGHECYNNAVKQLLPFKNSRAVKAAMIQDEYNNSQSKVHFINTFNIDIVFSVSPESEWSKIYAGVDFEKVKFYKVLTGYLDERGIRTINRFLKTTKKDIDIGYRARNLPQWLGRHGYLKTVIAEEFNKSLKRSKLNCSISTDPKDTFLGLDWYRFMVRCKYMIGVEGGATVLDSDGSIARNGAAYLKAHPDCSFEEIEQACFPGLDGKLQLIAISPRHLEACATRTCQLLVESTFNDILKPWIHYIPIKQDLSNIDEVLKVVEDDKKRNEIVENAYRDIVLKGDWSYRNAVKFVLDKCLLEARGEYFSRPTNYRFSFRNRLNDYISWKKYYFYEKLYHRLPDKWTFLGPIVKTIRFLGLKEVAKKSYFVITKRKSFP